MKKNGVLNAPLSRIIAEMGHMNKLVICDCGLPIPKKAEVVDLALTKNIPRFIDTLKVVLGELQVEQVIIAEELVKSGNGLFKEIKSLIPNVKITKVKHERFKNITKEDSEITFVRTGESTPYANIILISGVTF